MGVQIGHFLTCHSSVFLPYRAKERLLIWLCVKKFPKFPPKKNGIEASTTITTNTDITTAIVLFMRVRGEKQKAVTS